MIYRELPSRVVLRALRVPKLARSATRTSTRAIGRAECHGLGASSSVSASTGEEVRDDAEQEADDTTGNTGNERNEVTVGTAVVTAPVTTDYTLTLAFSS